MVRRLPMVKEPRRKKWRRCGLSRERSPSPRRRRADILKSRFPIGPPREADPQAATPRRSNPELSPVAVVTASSTLVSLSTLTSSLTGSFTGVIVGPKCDDIKARGVQRIDLIEECLFRFLD